MEIQYHDSALLCHPINGFFHPLCPFIEFHFHPFSKYCFHPINDFYFPQITDFLFNPISAF